MAKTLEEIKQLLSGELYKRGIKDRHIVINEDMSVIKYNCKNNTKRRLQNPEEFVQSEVFLKLIYEYDYLPENISVNESVQIGSDTREADILVYNNSNTKILIVVECKEENINERQFQVAVDQAYSYAHAKAAQYVWVTSGIKDEYFEITSVAPVSRKAIEIFNEQNSSIHLNLYPIRIDRTIEQSTYSIQDKILEAIQDCSLIIADLSSHNINVYHEIGYAMGIAKSNNDMLPNMILLYKENSDHNKDKIDVDKFIGFNLRNLSQLRFKEYDQLVEGLVKRLEKHYGV